MNASPIPLETPVVLPCCVCYEDVGKHEHHEQQGVVCDDCKTRLRWADAWCKKVTKEAA